mmetsp:Transcript_34342/g.55546  ORF Transcript_34342/g.55546 Transcript_34342/m.55546 type:complete len:99 (-) Transcript_34342:785-1081(-)
MIAVKRSQPSLKPRNRLFRSNQPSENIFTCDLRACCRCRPIVNQGVAIIDLYSVFRRGIEIHILCQLSRIPPPGTRTSIIHPPPSIGPTTTTPTPSRP